MQGAAGQLRVPISFLESLSFPLPPLSEQRRIVAALEEHLSALDVAVAGLARATASTTRYLEALLEDQVVRSLSDAPLTFLSSIARNLDQGWSPKCDNAPAEGEEWGVIKTTAVQPLLFQPDANKRLPSTLTPRPALTLREGDLLVTRAGPRSRVGVSCVVPSSMPRLMNCDKVYRVAFDRGESMPEYIALVLNSPEYRRRLDLLKSGISDSGVNLTQKRFLGLQVPLPTLAAQASIVDLVEQHRSVVAHTLAELGVQMARAERLRQAILTQAFSGGLVRQDPVDEPAGKLLSKASQQSSSPSRGRKRAISSHRTYG
jgi:type I restriction enzyme S subunit